MKPQSCVLEFNQLERHLIHHVAASSAVCICLVMLLIEGAMSTGPSSAQVGILTPQWQGTIEGTCCLVVMALLLMSMWLLRRSQKEVMRARAQLNALATLEQAIQGQKEDLCDRYAELLANLGEVQSRLDHLGGRPH